MHNYILNILVNIHEVSIVLGILSFFGCLMSYFAFAIYKIDVQFATEEGKKKFKLYSEISKRIAKFLFIVCLGTILIFIITPSHLSVIM